MKILKIAALSAAAVLFAGCASSKPMQDDNADLRAAVEEARAAAVQANQNSQQALALAQQNAEKIDRVFRGKQRK